MEELDHVRRESSIEENLLYVFDDGRGLRGGLQNDRVTSEESRYQSIDKNQIRILLL